MKDFFLRLLHLPRKALETVIPNFFTSSAQSCQENESNFDLLKLPIIAIEKVLNHMDPIDLLNFALLSPVCFHLSNCVKFKGTSLQCDFEVIQLEVQEYSNVFTFKPPREFPDKKAMCEWFRGWLDAYPQPFSCELHNVMFPIDELEENWAWLRKRQNSVSGLTFEHEMVTEAERAEKIIKMILEDGLEHVDYLCISFRLPHTFRYSGAFVFKHSPELLRFDYSCWITLDNLVNFASPEVILQKSELTNQDINDFLKLWKSNETAGLRRLKCLAILRKMTSECGAMDKDIILEGLGGTWRPENLVRVHPGFTKDDAIPPSKVEGGYDIRRLDGVIGTITVGELRENSGFRLDFFVW